MFNGELLKAWRGDRTQTQAAAEIGISQEYLCELEKGSKVPSLGMLRRISEISGIPATQFIEEKENPTSAPVGNLGA